jgi:hypothetical protein
VKIRARLAYGVVLKADVPDSPLFKALNMDSILSQAANYAKPALHAALTGALAKLAVLGVKVEFSDAKLDIVPVAEP